MISGEAWPPGPVVRLDLLGGLHHRPGIAGALVVATTWLQQKELRMAAIWILRYRQNRAEQIADIMLKKGPPASNDERPCDS